MSSMTLPSRLHHTAAVTKDLEATRRFYEDLLGLPLVATWCERDMLFGKERTYCHAFFGIGDGGALAFFQFADPEDQAQFGPEMPKTPFNHLAFNADAGLQNRIRERVLAAGYKEPDYFELDHGYCRSIYITDPNGIIIEFTCDTDAGTGVAAERRASARQDLARWLAGDHTPNNVLR